MDYKEALAYIESVSWLGSRPGLERISALLEELGRPQDGLKYIHIAGTNGKGSAAAMLASVMKAAGYKTGLFTSPYLSRFNERMQINGKAIDDEALADVVTRLAPAAAKLGDSPTEFELVTAAALMWFKEQGCQIVVLETGLGGRLDATNVISAPELSLIMNIGLDHTQVLGDTVEQIAAEKAGIIKPGCPCVLYGQSREVEEEIRLRCQELGSPLYISDPQALSPEFESLYGQSFSYKGESYALPLLGRHQLYNAAAVLEAVQALRDRGWALDQGDVEHGLYAVNWPGRFELIHDEPLFIVDGGHNPQCAQTVAETLGSLFPEAHRVLLVSLLRDKDCRGILDILDTAADEYVASQPVSDRALSAQELGDMLAVYGKPVTVCPDLGDAVEAACGKALKSGMVCAVGSLYSVGPIRACFGLD